MNPFDELYIGPRAKACGTLAVPVAAVEASGFESPDAVQIAILTMGLIHNEADKLLAVKCSSGALEKRDRRRIRRELDAEVLRLYRLGLEKGIYGPQPPGGVLGNRVISSALSVLAFFFPPAKILSLIYHLLSHFYATGCEWEP